MTLTGADLVESVTDNCEGLSLADLVITGAVSNEPDNEIGGGDDLEYPRGSGLQERSERSDVVTSEPSREPFRRRRAPGASTVL